ncbi:Calmodulin-like protein 3 [Tetrabaena socialis]|uniref:Calmodulin-like protein 3 n=1 Tax=Tetrabaena socialis TaxID=47790 RepID=A0A2J7ZZH5_9CHLO|nr:Calmodulin-like protein 3 [Tetrabaena socialis]|eukprot:PNH05670.1 Calmodulin-like protein 3 [Tetrabaena socialis]
MGCRVELLKEVFQLFDTEDKGYFTRDDLYFVMEAMDRSPTQQELDAVLYELDSDGNGIVDFPEFITKFLNATDEVHLVKVFAELAEGRGEGKDSTTLTFTAVERSFHNILDACTGALGFYLFGYAFAFGHRINRTSNVFIGDW